MLGAALLLLAVGATVGRLGAAGEEQTTAGSASTPGSPALSVPSPPVKAPHMVASRTREGAARTAAQALSAFADPQLLSSRQARRAVVARIAPPAYRAELDPLFDRTYDYLASILGGRASRGAVVLQMTPLGYRVEAFSRRRATVAVWQMTLLATPTRAPIAAWSTSRAELVWSTGRWRVERFGTDTPGPVPSVTAPATTAAPGDFVAAAQGFSHFAP